MTGPPLPIQVFWLFTNTAPSDRILGIKSSRCDDTINVEVRNCRARSRAASFISDERGTREDRSMVGEGTVFVVDDDAGSLRSLCWLIQQADLSVRPFRSGKEFLHSYQNEETGCLVLDVRMPEMGGLQLQQRLREKGIGLPIIFITAYGDVATCRQAMKEGAFDFFEKPLDDEILLAQIRKAIAHDRERRREGSTAKFAAGMNQLTPSEKDVLDLLISGKSLKEDRIRQRRHSADDFPTPLQCPPEGGGGERRGTGPHRNSVGL